MSGVEIVLLALVVLAVMAAGFAVKAIIDHNHVHIAAAEARVIAAENKASAAVAGAAAKAADAVNKAVGA